MARRMRELTRAGVGGAGRWEAIRRLEKLYGISNTDPGCRDARPSSIRRASGEPVPVPAERRDHFPKVSARDHAAYAEDAVLAEVWSGAVGSQHLSTLTGAVEDVCRAVATAGRGAFKAAVSGQTDQVATIERMAAPLVRGTLGDERFTAVSRAYPDDPVGATARLVAAAWWRAVHADEEVDAT
jgi:hypothetical protein